MSEVLFHTGNIVSLFFFLFIHSHTLHVCYEYPHAMHNVIKYGQCSVGSRPRASQLTNSQYETLPNCHRFPFPVTRLGSCASNAASNIFCWKAAVLLQELLQFCCNCSRPIVFCAHPGNCRLSYFFIEIQHKVQQKLASCLGSLSLLTANIQTSTFVLGKRLVLLNNRRMGTHVKTQDRAKVH